MLAAVMALAACDGLPRVTPTAANPQAIELFVQNAKLVPLRDVENRALHHCADYGFVSRRTDAEWVSASAMTFHFKCISPHQLAAGSKSGEAVVAWRRPGSGKSPAGRKQAAWNQANALSSDWAKCIQDQATHIARSTNAPADTAATVVVENCSRWEHDIQETLRRAGEHDKAFQADLHGQVIEFAIARILSVRASAPLAFDK